MKTRQKCRKQKREKQYAASLGWSAGAENSEKRRSVFLKYAFKDFQPVQYTPLLDSNISLTDYSDSQNLKTYYYNQDERQSVKNLTTTSGNIAQSYDYTAYGDKVDSLTIGTVDQRYTYTGRELNDVSGDYYFRYRMYGAGIGGFLSRDSLGFVDGTSVYSGYFAAALLADPYGEEVQRYTTPVDSVPILYNQNLGDSEVAGKFNTHGWADNGQGSIGPHVSIIRTGRFSTCCSIQVLGKLKLSILFPGAKGTEFATFVNGSGQRRTLLQHERGHYPQAVDNWNSMASSLNNFDGDIIDCDCAFEWQSWLEATADVYPYFARVDSLKYDIREYGHVAGNILANRLAKEEALLKLYQSFARTAHTNLQTCLAAQAAQ